MLRLNTINRWILMTLSLPAPRAIGLLALILACGLPSVLGWAQTPAAANTQATTSTAAVTPAGTSAGTGVLIPLTTGTQPAVAQELEVTTATTITMQNMELTTRTTVSIPVLGLTTTTTERATVAPATEAETSAAPTTGTAGETSATVASEAVPASTTAVVAEKTPTPAYLKSTQPLTIFDPEKSQTVMTPMLQAAKILADRKEKASRQSPVNMKNVVTEEYTLVGDDVSALAERAKMNALLAAAGHIYYGNHFILGRDLLAAYLSQNGNQFVTRANMTDRHALAGNQTSATFKVSVNLDAMIQDLQAKHFIAEPNLRPVVVVHLQEILNGQPDTSASGRQRIERTMEQNMFQVASTKMSSPPLGTDLSVSPDLLKEARLEAQRNNADVVITGTLSVRPITETQILYDTYNFQDADVVLKMYRADTGELIAEERDRYSAAAGSSSDSVARVLDSLLTRATQNLADTLTGMWANTMLDRSQTYRLMLTDIQPNQIPAIYNFLKTLSPDLAIYQKSYYGNVLVLNLNSPNVTEDKLAAFLRGFNEPQFTVRQTGVRHFTVDSL